MNHTVGNAICRSAGPNIGPVQPPKNMIVARADTVTTLAYSASMNMANFIELYSVCHPATSSCSDSARSNGKRFVSATALTRYTTNATGCRKMFQRGMMPSQVLCCAVTSSARLRVFAIIRTPTTDKVRLSS